MHSSARAGRSRSSAETNPYREAALKLLNEKIKGMNVMTSAQFDFAPLLPAGLPAPAAKWTGLAKYSFVGGNSDRTRSRLTRWRLLSPTSSVAASRRNTSTPSQRPEPDRHHIAQGPPRRTAEAIATIRRADLRGRLLCRPDLGRTAPARALWVNQ